MVKWDRMAFRVVDALIEPLKVIIIVAVCKILSVNIGCSTVVPLTRGTMLHLRQYL